MNQWPNIKTAMQSAAIVTVVLCLGASVTQADEPAKRQAFADQVAAHQLFDQMIQQLRDAQTLSFQCQYSREAIGVAKTSCSYKVWLKKPNFFRMETTSAEGEVGGIMIGDGKQLWVHWPNGRPTWKFVRETEADERTRFHSYMTKAAPAGKHSILHEANFLGGGMSLPIIELSTFHGYQDSALKHVDAVRSLREETVRGEVCNRIEVSLLRGQRRIFLSLSKKDFLPRELKEVVQVAYQNVAKERWTSVELNQPIPESLFKYTPPEHFVTWELPDYRDDLLPTGTEAPDFELLSIDGSKIKLSDFRGKAVWLCFWRVGCPPCRVETPYLQNLYEEHHDDNLVVLGVNVCDDRKLTLDYLREQKVTFPNVLDTSDKAVHVCDNVYGGGGVPLNYLIDRKGIIVDADFYHTSVRARIALAKVGIKLRQPNLPSKE